MRRGVDESEKWIEAVRNKRWGATEVGLAQKASGKRPLTLKQIFSEREAARRIVLATVLSVVTIVGWWAVSSWLPAYTAALAAAEYHAARNCAGCGLRAQVITRPSPPCVFDRL